MPHVFVCHALGAKHPWEYAKDKAADSVLLFWLGKDVE